MNDKDSQHLILHSKLIKTFLTNLYNNNKNVPFDEVDCKDNSYLISKNLTTVIQRPLISHLTVVTKKIPSRCLLITSLI